MVFIIFSISSLTLLLLSSSSLILLSAMVPKISDKNQSPASYDKYKFISPEADRRFIEFVLSKQLIPDRSLPVMRTIISRGLEQFCEESYAAIVNVVREFFCKCEVVY
ncbi:hypothetical protein KFK09_013462 [Dendrobium nobile]|uniref:Uncharacterized protein n=1 Tax=Dendrobium nobile TaxID=94219 RepID=A0A8T3B7A1_DENNO|nr:hypothetical protein KFK09_013462 [Dendrobium nobile]